MITIAMLPTGDWAVTDHSNVVYFYEFTDDDYREFEEAGAEDVTLAKGIGQFPPLALIPIPNPCWDEPAPNAVLGEH